MSLLFPTDLSDNSVKAFEFAYYMAKKLQQPITLLHVFPTPVPAPTIDDAGMDVITEDIMIATENAVTERLKQFKEELKQKYSRNHGDAIRVDEIISMGFTGDEIIRTAENMHASYIIMCVQAASAMKRVLFGSTTMHVLKKSKIPVITIPENYSVKEFKNIGYATDLTFSDNEIINKLLFFAQIFNSHIKCFHVHDSNLDVENSIIQDFITQYKKEANEGLISFQLVDNISTLDGIEYFIKENAIDLLALFKQKKYLTDLFEKSITKQVLFHTSIPLLVYHE